ncbi:MAG: hypothetical protein B7X40_06575, partial [Cellulomonas sp. 14-74-6]
SPTGVADTVVVVVNLDPFHPREGMVLLDLEALGLPALGPVRAHDLLTDATFWWGPEAFVRLDPTVSCAHVVHVDVP